MSTLHSSVACNLDTHILLAVLPLFEAEKVQAIEWSFDALFHQKSIPAWFEELLHAYANENRLIGHGVFFSLFAGRWSSHQQDWLQHLKQFSQTFQFQHITEHFGFMTGADFHAGAPISLPFTTTVLNIGIDRLQRIQDACQCPVGLENLAFSYSLEEVKKHGEFLEKLVEPVNGFIILDLHNLYCQIHNFDIAFEDIIRLYPLERVREIHISGGSWDETLIVPGKKIRRDTHDEAVPGEVFDLLKKTIPMCPNLQFVVLEQLGTALHTEESQRLFQQDFYKMDDIVNASNTTPRPAQTNDFKPVGFTPANAPVESEALHQQQFELSRILENAVDYHEAQQLLANSSLANTAWNSENWAPYMLETAMRIAQKWKVS